MQILPDAEKSDIRPKDKMIWQNIEEILFFIVLDLTDFITASIFRIITTYADGIANLTAKFLDKPRGICLVTDCIGVLNILNAVHSQSGAFAIVKSICKPVKRQVFFRFAPSQQKKRREHK